MDMGKLASMAGSVLGGDSAEPDSNALADQLYEKIWPILSDKLCNKFSENAENMSGRIVEYIANKMEEKPEMILVIVQKMLDIMEPPSGVNREAEKKHLVELLENISKNLEETKQREEALLAASNIPVPGPPEASAEEVLAATMPVNSTDINSLSNQQNVPLGVGMMGSTSNLTTPATNQFQNTGAPAAAVMAPAMAMGALAGTMGTQATNAGSQALNQLQNMAANKGMNMDAANNMGANAFSQLQNMAANKGMNVDMAKNLGTQAFGQFQNMAANKGMNVDMAKNLGTQAFTMAASKNPMVNMGVNALQGLLKKGGKRKTRFIPKMKKRKYTRRK